MGAQRRNCEGDYLPWRLEALWLYGRGNPVYLTSVSLSPEVGGTLTAGKQTPGNQKVRGNPRGGTLGHLEDNPG